MYNERLRTYCLGCNKPKFRFYTKLDALKYINFYCPGIMLRTGVAPWRPYWCEQCQCWHVTHYRLNNK